jgi:peptidoglycan/LPS O-acetylase OafA/YrhL
MNLDRVYVRTGLIWLVLGMVYGIYLGITDQLNLANSHAHANLLGFVTSCLFGLLHRNWPDMRRGRLAVPQFWIYQVGVVLLIAGKVVVDMGGTPGLAAIGSIVVVLGTALMIVMFFDQRD